MRDSLGSERGGGMEDNAHIIKERTERERQRQRDRPRERERDRQTDRQTRETETETERENPGYPPLHQQEKPSTWLT